MRPWPAVSFWIVTRETHPRLGVAGGRPRAAASSTQYPVVKMRKRKNPEAVLAASEKKRSADAMRSGQGAGLVGTAAIVAGALILAWLWTKLKF